MAPPVTRLLEHEEQEARLNSKPAVSSSRNARDLRFIATPFHRDAIASGSETAAKEISQKIRLALEQHA
jgi:hypothetical protein